MRRLMVAALLSLVVACAGQPPPSPPSPVTYRTGINPVAIGVGRGVLWAANAGDGTVSKIDLASRRTVARIPIGDINAYSDPCMARNIHQVPHGSFSIRMCDLPAGLALGPQALWVTKNDTHSLLRIDPLTDRVTSEIPIGIDAWYVTATATAVWATDWGTSAVVRVDPSTNQVVARIPDVPLGPTGIVATSDAVWVACSRADVVARIDPVSNRVVATIPVGHTPLPIAAGFGSVWVRNENNEIPGTVSRIDPLTNRVAATIPAGMATGRDGLDGLAVTDRGVWVSGLDLEQIDPTADRVTRRIRHTANWVTAAGGAVWTIDIAYSVTRFPD
jgi:DNA-binding beta-propeller fold protein YncE